MSALAMVLFGAVIVALALIAAVLIIRGNLTVHAGRPRGKAAAKAGAE